MKPSFPFVLQAAWNDTLASLNRLRYLALVVLLICSAEELARAFVLPKGKLEEMSDTLLSAISFLAIVPYEIAIYRLIILREVTERYSFAAATNRVRRFLAWSAILWIATTAPVLIFDLLPIPNGLNAVLTIAIVIVGAVIILRLILLFPAIAVDSAGATATNAIADSDRRLWLIVRSVFVPFIPIILATAGLMALAWFNYVGDLDNSGATQRIVRAVLLGTLETITITTSVVVVARLYEWIGERVK